MADRFLLLEVIERDIQEPVSFPSREEAHAAMIKQLKDVMGLTDEDIQNADICESPIIDTKTGKSCCTTMCIDDETYFGNWHASCERCGQNYDWRIFKQET